MEVFETPQRKKRRREDEGGKEGKKTITHTVTEHKETHESEKEIGNRSKSQRKNNPDINIRRRQNIMPERRKQPAPELHI